MTTPFEDMTEIDRLVHDPSRLAITSALSACESADFLFLQRVTGLSKGNLSSHLAKLEKGGIVRIEKTGQRRPRTVVSLTEPGRAAAAEHWDRLLRLHEAARTWVPSES
ncbi:DNA-binding transcriptional ArsR family regulator [Nonomuraea thailandensis]|uniref:DNA-binding transcriptional ArsR family regulator n=1 Tax=Nonomuraea thailandensis TaxID=1188745 RepID=A0A9X2GGE8_9ACTN|nr:transcriptional regulator [Nonomuraea thailandensis]MCP2357185.1 DNA-binding transcriptional ArsR family regulator [Nonomuraea thailandensis]